MVMSMGAWDVSGSCRFRLESQDLHEPGLDKVHQKRQRHDEERGGQLMDLAPHDLDKGVREHASPDAIGAAVGERHGQHGGQGGEALVEITKMM